METISLPASAFWPLITSLGLAFTFLLALVLVFQNSKTKSRIDFKALAKELRINAYEKPHPYAAGVYQGRGIILQEGKGSLQPPVSVFCDNPNGRQFCIHSLPKKNLGLVKKLTQPSFTAEAEWENFFKIEPEEEVFNLSGPSVRKAAIYAARSGLQGKIELKGRNLSFIEHPQRPLATSEAYLAALDFCLALSNTLEHETVTPAFEMQSKEL